MDPNLRITPEHIESLSEGEVFVFGSNLRGMHGAGAARAALRWGAETGVGEGPSGSTYAIPTMFATAAEIAPYVDRFIAYARRHPGLKFLVTKIGCGIAGFAASEIAPLFSAAAEVENIYLPAEFLEIITQLKIQ